MPFGLQRVVRAEGALDVRLRGNDGVELLLLLAAGAKAAALQAQLCQRRRVGQALQH